MKEEINRYEINDESLEKTNGGFNLNDALNMTGNEIIRELVTRLKEKYPTVDEAIQAFLADMAMFGPQIYNVVSKFKESQIVTLIKSKWNTV